MLQTHSFVKKQPLDTRSHRRVPVAFVDDAATAAAAVAASAAAGPHAGPQTARCQHDLPMLHATLHITLQCLIIAAHGVLQYNAPNFQYFTRLICSFWRRCQQCSTTAQLVSCYSTLLLTLYHTSKACNLVYNLSSRHCTGDLSRFRGRQQPAEE